MSNHHCSKTENVSEFVVSVEEAPSSLPGRVAIVTSAFPIDEICPVTIVTVQSLPPGRLFIAKSKDVLRVVAAVLLISLMGVAQKGE